MVSLRSAIVLAVAIFAAAVFAVAAVASKARGRRRRLLAAAAAEDPPEPPAGLAATEVVAELPWELGVNQVVDQVSRVTADKSLFVLADVVHPPGHSVSFTVSRVAQRNRVDSVDYEAHRTEDPRDRLVIEGLGEHSGWTVVRRRRTRRTTPRGAGEGGGEGGVYWAPVYDRVGCADPRGRFRTVLLTRDVPSRISAFLPPAAKEGSAIRSKTPNRDRSPPGRSTDTRRPGDSAPSSRPGRPAG